MARVTFEDFDTLRHVTALAVSDWTASTFSTHGPNMEGLTTLITAGAALDDLCFPGQPIPDDYLEIRTSVEWSPEVAAALRTILLSWSDWTTRDTSDPYWCGQQPDALLALEVFDRLAGVPA